MPNLFNDQVPPNMDATCVTTVSSTICSDPWSYYKANTVDIALFVLGFVLAYLFITRR